MPRVRLPSPLEVLNGTLVAFSRFAGLERPQVFALATFVLLLRVQPVAAGFEFSDHTSELADEVPTSPGRSGSQIARQAVAVPV